MNPVILLAAAFLLAPPAAQTPTSTPPVRIRKALPFTKLHPRIRRIIRSKPCPGLAASPDEPASLRGWQVRYRISNLGMHLGDLTARIRGEQSKRLSVSITCELRGIFARLIAPRLEQKGSYPLANTAAPVQVSTALKDKIYRFRIEADGRRATSVTIKKDDQKKSTRKRSFRRRCGIHDAVGLLLHLRTRKLEPGTSLHAHVLVGRRLWRISGKVEKNGSCATAAGNHSCIKLTGTARRPGRREPVALALWLSDDRWRLPLKIGVQRPLGDLELELQDTRRFVTKPPMKSACRSARGSPKAPSGPRAGSAL